MSKASPFADFLHALRTAAATFPDIRKGKNKHYTVRDARAIALKGVSKDEVGEIRIIPTGLEPFVVNSEFGARILA
jgi:hypothetical protein